MAVFESPVLENKTDAKKTKRQKEVEKLYGKVYELELMEEDGIPLETQWHRIQMNMLIDLVFFWWKDRDNFFVGGNMFIYFNYEQAKNRDYRGPDVFVVDNVDGKKNRPYWAVWEEKDRYPDIIIELASPSTISIDLGFKKNIYEKIFKTKEYYCYNPDKQELLGWKLVEGRYEALKPNEEGWLYSEKLGVWLGKWEGKRQRVEAVWLRFFTKNKELVPTSEELAIKRADEESRRADEKTRLAQEEAKRAQKSEEEVEKLRSLLAKHGIEEDQ